MTSFAPLGRILAVLALLTLAHRADAVAVLSASVIVQSGSSACVGTDVLVTLTVSNTGDANADSVTAYVTSVVSSGGNATLTGPTPALDPSFVLLPGDSVVYSYTAVGTSAGTVVTRTLSFTASAAGQDTGSATETASGLTTSSAVTLTGLTGKAFVSPAGNVSVGSSITVTLSVTNWTASAISSVVPKIRVGPGAGSVVLVSGPSPASVDLLDPGAKQTFTWSYNATAAGVVTFSATASGTPGCGTAAAALAWSSVSSTVQTAAALSVTLVATSVTATGMPITVRVTVTNTGTAAANVVKPANLTLSLTGGTTAGSTTVFFTVSVVGGIPAASSPSASVNLGSNALVTFTWSLTAGTVGRIVFSTTVTATDKNSGATMTKFVSCILLTGNKPPALAFWHRFERSDLGAGQTVRFVLTVTNTGSSAITNLTPALATSGAADIGAASPASVASLAANGVVTFTWDIVPRTAGRLVFNASVAGTAGGNPVSIADSFALEGIPAPEAESSYVFPSPAGDSARIAYTLAGPGGVKLRVYNAVGDKVATVDDPGKGAGLQFTDLATSGLAPGVYFYFVDIAYDAGTTEKQKVRKFVVRH